ncbi:hypothetical protein BpHYR1_040012 [Brachionus plicatilis]|uniref:Uncharacterized protein n=1 Tax=Brachionus plicatilis TaxID=10195 RepID=A0A3M7QZX8_BRAPC|nr:hypothetical protein BpHYR1_040012 [Brachionus plicatilis]
MTCFSIKQIFVTIFIIKPQATLKSVWFKKNYLFQINLDAVLSLGHLDKQISNCIKTLIFGICLELNSLV